MTDEQHKSRSAREVELDELLKAAELEEKTIELEQKKLDVRKTAAEAEQAEANAAAVKLALDEKVELRDFRKAQDVYQHIYNFTTQVNEASVYACMTELTAWSRLSPGCDIEVVFNSPGGSVVEGLALYDFLQTLRRKGHKVTTTALGMAASMAGILLQAGDVRRMGAESWVLIHQGSYGAMGSVGEVKDRVKWVEKIQERILDIFAGRSNMTKAAIKKQWERTDWWLSSDECIKFGFVDELV